MPTSQPSPQSNAEDLARYVAAMDKIIRDLVMQDAGPICRDARTLLRAKHFGEKWSKAAQRRIAKFATTFAATPRQDFRLDNAGRLITDQDGTPKRPHRPSRRAA